MAFVWQLSIIQTHEKTLISGVIVRGRSPRAFTSRTALGNAWMIFSSYFYRPYAHQVIAIRSGDETLEAQTDSKGGFHIESEESLPSGIQIIAGPDRKVLRVNRGLKKLHRLQERGLSVISDIDDTILVSYTGKRIQSIFNTLFRPYQKRKAVLFTRSLFESFRQENPDHFYVSRSEYNLFPLIADFIEHNRLPKGPILLTPFRRYRELLTEKKDPDFKLNSIEYIIRSSREKEFILVGDDSQQDIEIYSRISERFKEQIRAVYIRQTDTKKRMDETDLWETLTKQAPIAVYFGKHDVFEDKNDTL